MSLALHAGHYAHPFVKAFVNFKADQRRSADKRLSVLLPCNNFDTAMPSRASRIKREPVVTQSDDDYLRVDHEAPQSLNTPALPLRGSSVVSAGGAATTAEDVEMAESNGDATNPTAVGAQALATGSRQFIQSIQKLEALNIKATLPSLPKFVIIGDQSAGKSSIIEALSDITLPRSEGTCTRCPFKITTTGTDGPWTCKVSLHIKYNFDPRNRTGAGNGRKTFQQWTESQDIVEVDFATVSDKTQLEITLRRAQFALLNPDKNPMYFVNMPMDSTETGDAQTVSFSPNVISLYISAPGLPELSFYDLPGAVNTLGDESQQYLVDFVHKLLESYIGEEKALIVLACAANQDLEVSTAFRYLRECQASNRAMGVLTKPDLMEVTPSRIKALEGVLSGQKNHKVGGSWFVTRQLSQQELDQRTGYGEAREKEKRFFSTEPWASRPLSAYSHRFGISNLQAALSQKLTDHIRRDLPEIIERVNTRLTEVQAHLATFPEQAVAPSMAVVMDIDKVRSALIEQLNADSLRSTFRKPYRDVFRDLGKKLQALKPKINMTTPGYQKPTINIGSSDDEDESPSKSVRMNNGRGMSVIANTPNRASRPPRRTPASSAGSDQNEGRVFFRLDDVKARFDAAPGADLPAQASESVVRDLITGTLTGWPTATDATLRQLWQIFTRMLNGAVDSALGQRQNTQLYARVTEIVHALFQELFQTVEHMVHTLIAAETHRPITYNDSLKQKRAVYKVEFRRLRQEKRVSEWADMQEAETNKIINEADRKKKAADVSWVNSTLGHDEYDRELDALATPVAYYEIASTQLVDTIAKVFESGLMHAFETRIHRKLLEDLRTGDTEYCAQLLAEDPERERERIRLLAEQSKLEAALAELNQLPV